MSKRRNYNDAVKEFVKAVDLSIETKKKYRPEQDVLHEEGLKQMAENAEPQFKSIRSLKYLEEALFTYYNEGADEDVNYFWSLIKENNLPYERENKLEKILAKNKISNIHEYDFVTDGLVVYQQEGIITAEQAATLSLLIGEYEQGKAK